MAPLIIQEARIVVSHIVQGPLACTATIAKLAGAPLMEAGADAAIAEMESEVTPAVCHEVDP